MIGALVVSTVLAACEPAPPTVTVRPLVFPVVGRVSYTDTFGAPRSGGRSHEGQDLMASKGQTIVAVADGTITSVRSSPTGLSGNMITLTDADGWRYYYIHINNDRPGTDDGANIYEQAFVDGVRAGQRVRAGEPIAYVGDSGNAETTAPHLHFEMHRPDGSTVNAFASLQAANKRARTAAEVAAAAPIGVVDSVKPAGAGKIRTIGWALDRKANAPVDVSVYVDGNPKLTQPAKASRPGVATKYPGRGALHGFDLTVPGITPGVRKVCIIAHNAALGGGSSRLRCMTVTVA